MENRHMKLVEVTEAVGLVLVHDVTEVTRNPDRKHTAFRRGHMVREEDVPRLLDLGKRHVYVTEPDPGTIHENDGALRLAKAIAREGLQPTEPLEGKVNLTARWDGVIVVDADGVNELNRPGDVICVTRQSYSSVSAGQTAAAVRVMPLFIDCEAFRAAEDVARSRGGLVAVRQLRRFRAGIVVTGSEVFSGRVKDAFGPVMRKKLAAFGSAAGELLICDDEPAHIEQAIRSHLTSGHDMIVVTGGMSVDPDDRTPAAIRNVATRVAFQWAPALPGCMTMLAAAESPATGEEVPILGVPACAIHYERTTLDLLLLRLVAGEFPTEADARLLGHGGLCLECSTCRFPNCSFGSV
jgi:hypothetical protein